MIRQTVLNFACVFSGVFANVDKTIFLGPPAVAPDVHASLDELNTLTLTPQDSLLRLHLPVAFPTASQPNGLQSWYLLDGLTPSQRYEVRLCWAAIQPAKFWLYPHELTDVFDSSALLSALTENSQSREPSDSSYGNPSTNFEHIVRVDRSVLLLQIFAAADFFTTNKTLMSSPPPVLVDIILDPFVWNLIPKSLIPTIAYIAVIVVGSWYIAKYSWKWLLKFDSADNRRHVE